MQRLSIRNPFSTRSSTACGLLERIRSRSTDSGRILSGTFSGRSCHLTPRPQQIRALFVQNTANRIRDSQNSTRRIFRQTEFRSQGRWMQTVNLASTCFREREVVGCRLPSGKTSQRSIGGRARTRPREVITLIKGPGKPQPGVLVLRLRTTSTASTLRPLVQQDNRPAFRGHFNCHCG